MTEQERKEAINKINRYLELKEERKQKKKKLEELAKNDIVKEYLDYLSEVQKLNQILRGQSTKEDTIELAFKQEFNDLCSHDIYIYMGSYSYLHCGLDGRWYESLVPNELDDGFIFNYYGCLCCDKTIEVSDWKKFEETHFVLKNYSDTNDQKYTSLYYQLLYNHTDEDTKRMVIEEFNKNKELILKKTK